VIKRIALAKPSVYSESWVDRLLPKAERIPKVTWDALKRFVDLNNIPDNMLDDVLQGLANRLKVKAPPLSLSKLLASDDSFEGVIAVDLDGTLAHHDPQKPFDISYIGDPIPLMVNRVKRALASGRRVVVFTARAADPKFDPRVVKVWTLKHIGQELEVTNEKLLNMVEFWDDKAISVKPNTGEITLRRDTQMSSLPRFQRKVLAALRLDEPANYQIQAGVHTFAVRKIISQKTRNGIVFSHKLMDGTEWSCDDFEIKDAETVDGNYIGDWDWANQLIKRGIVPELSRPDHNVCSIGFCEKEQKWWGWSHRAMASFGLGDRIFEEDYGDDKTLFTQHGPVVIKTLDQAKQAAINFADYVS
jgi:hypothetical protein